MTSQEIQKIQKLNSEIENFRDCYEGIELYGEVESFVSVEKLIEFLIENPHLADIAKNISKIKES